MSLTSIQLDALTNLTRQVRFWEKAKGGFVLHLLDNTKVKMRNRRLAATDKRLLSYLQSNATCKRVEDNAIGVFGGDVDDNVGLWSGRVVTLKACNGQRYLIYSLREVSHDGGVTKLTGSFKKVADYHKVAGRRPLSYEYTSTEDVTDILVSNAWLEATFPGWEQRWETLVGLDMERDLWFVFPKQATTGANTAQLPVDLC